MCVFFPNVNIFPNLFPLLFIYGDNDLGNIHTTCWDIIQQKIHKQIQDMQRRGSGMHSKKRSTFCLRGAGSFLPLKSDHSSQLWICRICSYGEKRKKKEKKRVPDACMSIKAERRTTRVISEVTSELYWGWGHGSI